MHLFADICSYIGREAVWDEMDGHPLPETANTLIYIQQPASQRDLIYRITPRSSVLKNDDAIKYGPGLCKSTLKKQLQKFQKLFTRTCIVTFFKLSIKQNLKLLHDISHSQSYFAFTSHTPVGDRWGRQQQQSYLTDLVYVPLYTPVWLKLWQFPDFFNRNPGK